MQSIARYIAEYIIEELARQKDDGNLHLLTLDLLCTWVADAMEAYEGGAE